MSWRSNSSTSSKLWATRRIRSITHQSLHPIRRHTSSNLAVRIGYAAKSHSGGLAMPDGYQLKGSLPAVTFAPVRELHGLALRTNDIWIDEQAAEVYAVLQGRPCSIPTIPSCGKRIPSCAPLANP